MNGYNFIKATPCGALLTDMLPPISHVATENRPSIPGSLGMPYDSVLYVDCQARVTKCQDINFPGRSPQGEQTWSDSDELSPYTSNIIQVWTNDAGVNRDQEKDGYAYIRKQCMHCVDPNCVSACPASALKKDPKTDIVHHDKDVCTGCRYCIVACPYNVPKYDYNNPFGALHKCELYNQKGVERLNKGGLPGCVEVCPAGVVVFGTCEELMAETKKRLTLGPGSKYHYPRQTLKSGDTYLHMMPKYYPHLYGEKEDGGTQVLILADVPYENLDLPKLDDFSTGTRSEHIQHALYKGAILPLAMLAGLTALVRRNAKNNYHNGGDDHESWSTTTGRQNRQ